MTRQAKVKGPTPLFMLISGGIRRCEHLHFRKFPFAHKRTLNTQKKNPPQKQKKTCAVFAPEFERKSSKVIIRNRTRCCGEDNNRLIVYSCGSMFLHVYVLNSNSSKLLSERVETTDVQDIKLPRYTTRLILRPRSLLTRLK